MEERTTVELAELRASVAGLNYLVKTWHDRAVAAGWVYGVTVADAASPDPGPQCERGVFTEWIHEGRPPWRSHAQVWMADGSVREVVTVETVMGPLLHFTDCTHPLQNVFCDSRKVRAWRLPPPPLPKEPA